MGVDLFQHFTLGSRLADGTLIPTALRVPLCPFVFGLLHWITGDQTLTFFTYTLLQVMVTPVIPCTAYFFGRRIDRLTALCAYLFLLFHANVLMCSLMTLTDAFFAAACCGVYIVTWKTLRRRSLRWALCGGLAAGASCMIRPIMKLYFLPVILLLIFRACGLRLFAGMMVMFLAGYFIVMSPWLARNAMLYGRPVVETLEGDNMLWNYWDLVTVRGDDPSGKRKIKEWILSIGNYSRAYFMFYNGEDYWKKNSVIVSDELQEIAWETYREHPIEILRRWGINCLRMTGSYSHHDEMLAMWLNSPLYLQIRDHLFIAPEMADRIFQSFNWMATRLLRVCYLIVAPLGLALLFFRKRALAVFIAMIIAYFTSITAIVAGYDRYRLCLEPLFAVAIIYPLIRGTAKYAGVLNASRGKNLFLHY